MFASTLEPLASDIVSIAVDIGTVPVGLAKFVRAVEVRKTFFVAASRAIGTRGTLVQRRGRRPEDHCDQVDAWAILISLCLAD